MMIERLQSALQRLLVMLVPLYALCPFSAWAGKEVSRLPVSISGVIVEPTCTITPSGAIGVEFNNVDVVRVSSGAYQKKINISVSCTQNAAVKMTLKAKSSTFDQAAILTSVSGLGVKISRSGGQVWKPDEQVLTKSASNNSITATLVSKPGSSLKEGKFSATATISVAYN